MLAYHRWVYWYSDIVIAAMASGEGRRQTDVPRILKVRINFEKVPAFTNSNNIFPGNPENRWRAAMPLLLHLLPQPPLQLLQTFGGEEHGKGKQFVCCSQIKHHGSISSDYIQVFSQRGVLGNPIVGMILGVLATVLVQSSSTTTSIVVGMVASGVLEVK